MSGGGGGPSNTTQTTKVEYSPEEQAARNQVMSAALGTYDKAQANNDGIYRGARPIGAGGVTQQAQQMALQNAWAQTAQLDKTQAANNFGLHDALFAESNPYLQSAMTAATRPMEEQFAESGGALQGIRQGAIQSGGYGGSRQGIAEGIATKGLNNKIADTRSTMAYQGYRDGLDQQQAAIKAQGMLSLLSQMPQQQVAAVGAQQDAQAQQMENYSANAAQYANTAQWEPIQNLANVIYGGSNGTTTATGQGPAAPDNTAATVGAIGSTALMALMMY
jgi:hypothetical protein